jgi:hypothetical protein
VDRAARPRRGELDDALAPGDHRVDVHGESEPRAVEVLRAVHIRDGTCTTSIFMSTMAILLWDAPAQGGARRRHTIIGVATGALRDVLDRIHSRSGAH